MARVADARTRGKELQGSDTAPLTSCENNLIGGPGLCWRGALGAPRIRGRRGTIDVDVHDDVVRARRLRLPLTLKRRWRTAHGMVGGGRCWWPVVVARCGDPLRRSVWRFVRRSVSAVTFQDCRFWIPALTLRTPAELDTLTFVVPYDFGSHQEVVASIAAGSPLGKSMPR